MKVTCIDDSHKPNSISLLCWVKKDKEYTIVKLKRHILSNTQYFVLKEVQPDDAIYGGYNVNRFALTKKQLDEAIEKSEIVVEELLEAV